MITRDQLMYAIATAIRDRQDLYIDTYARSSADDDDFYYLEGGENVNGYTLLLATSTYISHCIEGERMSDDLDDGLICAQDIQNGWDESAPMPSLQQIREYVAACDSNDNFADMIEMLEDMDVLPHHEGSSITYTLTRDAIKDIKDTLDMTCNLRRPDGSIAGTYHFAKIEDEMWTVDTLTGPDWDDVTGMTTNRARAVWDDDDNEELDRCYYRTRIVIRITLPFCIAGLTDEETRALYIAHEQRDAVAAAAHMARTAAQPYTLNRAVDLLNMLDYLATDGAQAFDNLYIQDQEECYDDDAHGVRHYPARAQVEATGKNAEEYLRAVSMLSGRTPDDAESDEDTIWHYYNA